MSRCVCGIIAPTTESNVSYCQSIGGGLRTIHKTLVHGGFNGGHRLNVGATLVELCVV